MFDNRAVTDYDKSGIDYRQHHVTMGPGGGKDLVFQNGKFFTSFGRQIEPTMENLKSEGIPVTREIESFLQKHTLRKKEAALRAKLEVELKRIEDREKQRIMNNLSGSVTAGITDDEGDIEQELNDIDLTGLEDLLEEDEPEADEPEIELEPEKAKPKSPTIKARSKKRK